MSRSSIYPHPRSWRPTFFLAALFLTIVGTPRRSERAPFLILATPPALAATCGDAVTDPTEQCDDGPANGTTASCCTATCTFASAGTACVSGVCAGGEDRCVASTCSGDTPDGWAFVAELSAGEGLVVKDVRFGPRLLARRMSVPYVVVQSFPVGSPQYGRLSPAPTGDGITSRLERFDGCKQVGDGTGDVAVSATYRLTPAAGYDILVDQTYRFARFDPNDKHCESTKTVPCARIWPTVTWALADEHALHPNFGGFEAVQRFEFDPDGLGSGAADAFADTLAAHITLDGGLPVGFGIRELGNNGKLRKEDSRVVILGGKRHDWDSYHQSSREQTSLPGIDPLKKKPGCSDCVHAHWSWGLDANCGCSALPPPACRDVQCWTDGQPAIERGSEQSAAIGWVKYDPTEIDPWAKIKTCAALGLPPGDGTQEKQSRELWHCLIDARSGNAKASKIAKTDRLVMYWDDFSNAAHFPFGGVTIGGQLYTFGDAFWPRLTDVLDPSALDRTHGNSGEIFFLAARRLADSATPATTAWTVEPQWAAATQQPTPLDPRLPAGWVLPVKITHDVPAVTTGEDRGPFYLRVRKSCSNTLRNPDTLFLEHPSDAPWIQLRQDVYTPPGAATPGSFQGGAIVRTVVGTRPTTLTAYLVFASRPLAADIRVELVAAPNGTDGYVPLVDSGLDGCPVL